MNMAKVELGAGGVLLVLCNNCKPFMKTERKISILYKPKYLKLVVLGKEKEPSTAGLPDVGDYETGIRINAILDSVYGLHQHREMEYANVNRRLNTLVKRNIVEGSASEWRLHTDMETFRQMLIVLAREGKVFQLMSTAYFKEYGNKYLQSIYQAIPEGLLDIDTKDARQNELYICYLFNRYLKSPTFREIFLAPKLTERLTSLQNALNTSYLRNQSVKNRFPFLQTLGTFCVIIDSLRADNAGTVLSPLSVEELVECLNDTDRAAFRHQSLNKSQLESAVKGLYSPASVKAREQLLKSRTRSYPQNQQAEGGRRRAK